MSEVKRAIEIVRQIIDTTPDQCIGCGRAATIAATIGEKVFSGDISIEDAVDEYSLTFVECDKGFMADKDQSGFLYCGRQLSTNSQLLEDIRPANDSERIRAITGKVWESLSPQASGSKGYTHDTTE